MAYEEAVAAQAAEATKQAAIRILSEPVCAGFGPTSESEYLNTSMD